MPARFKNTKELQLILSHSKISDIKVLGMSQYI